MSTDGRMRLVFHGATVLLVGLLCGFATATEHEPIRMWHTAHEALIMIGTLILALSAVVPHLVLEKREATGLRWSIMAMAYGLMVGVILQAIGGETAMSPSKNPLMMTAFLFNTAGIGGSVLTASLTMMGAHAARKAAVVAAAGSN